MQSYNVLVVAIDADPSARRAAVTWLRRGLRKAFGRNIDVESTTLPRVVPAKADPSVALRSDILAHLTRREERYDQILVIAGNPVLGSRSMQQIPDQD